MPVMYAAAGNCHVFVDATADLDDAVAIAVNAKVQRPVGLQRGRDAAGARRRRGGVPAARARASCASRGVELRVDGRTRALAGDLADSLARRDRGGLGDRVPRADPGGEGGGLARRGDRARQPLRLRPLGGDRDRLDRVRAGVHRRASTRPACTSTPRRASPTAPCSAWAPRSATRPRSCTPAGRSALRELTTYKFVVEGSGQVRE